MPWVGWTPQGSSSPLGMKSIGWTPQGSSSPLDTLRTDQQTRKGHTARPRYRSAAAASWGLLLKTIQGEKHSEEGACCEKMPCCPLIYKHSACHPCQRESPVEQDSWVLLCAKMSSNLAVGVRVVDSDGESSAVRKDRQRIPSSNHSKQAPGEGKPARNDLADAKPKKSKEGTSKTSGKFNIIIHDLQPSTSEVPAKQATKARQDKPTAETPKQGVSKGAVKGLEQATKPQQDKPTAEATQKTVSQNATNGQNQECKQSTKKKADCVDLTMEDKKIAKTDKEAIDLRGSSDEDTGKKESPVQGNKRRRLRRVEEDSEGESGNALPDGKNAIPNNVAHEKGREHPEAESPNNEERMQLESNSPPVQRDVPPKPLSGQALEKWVQEYSPTFFKAVQHIAKVAAGEEGEKMKVFVLPAGIDTSGLTFPRVCTDGSNPPKNNCVRFAVDTFKDRFKGMNGFSNFRVWTHPCDEEIGGISFAISFWMEERRVRILAGKNTTKWQMWFISDIRGEKYKKIREAQDPHELVQAKYGTLCWSQGDQVIEPLSCFLSRELMKVWMDQVVHKKNGKEIEPWTKQVRLYHYPEKWGIEGFLNKGMELDRELDDLVDNHSLIGDPCIGEESKSGTGNTIGAIAREIRRVLMDSDRFEKHDQSRMEVNNGTVYANFALRFPKNKMLVLDCMVTLQRNQGTGTWKIDIDTEKSTGNHMRLDSSLGPLLRFVTTPEGYADREVDDLYSDTEVSDGKNSSKEPEDDGVKPEQQSTKQQQCSKSADDEESEDLSSKKRKRIYDSSEDGESSSSSSSDSEDDSKKRKGKKGTRSASGNKDEKEDRERKAMTDPPAPLKKRKRIPWNELSEAGKYRCLQRGLRCKIGRLGNLLESLADHLNRMDRAERNIKKKKQQKKGGK